MGLSDFYKDALPYIDFAGARVLDFMLPGAGVAAQFASQNAHEAAYGDDIAWIGDVSTDTAPSAQDNLAGATGAAGQAMQGANSGNKAQQDRYDFAALLAAAQARDAALSGRQGTFLDDITARAEGRAGPSLAEMQLQQSLAQNQANAAGFMASQRGLNPALAARSVGNQQAGMAQTAAGQGAMLRAQEQLAAQQLLGQTLAGIRGQEQDLLGLGAQGMQGQNALSAQIGAGDADRRLGYSQLASQDQYRRDQTALGMREEDRQQQGGVMTALGKVGTAAAQMKGGMDSGGSGVDHGGMDPYDYSDFEGWADGGQVPGEPKHPGRDVASNDEVLALLTPDEIVLPLSVTQADDPGQAAKDFVEACLEEESKKRGKSDAKKAA